MSFLIDISGDAIANPCCIPISKFQTCQRNFGSSLELESCGLRYFCEIKLRAPKVGDKRARSQRKGANKARAAQARAQRSQKQRRRR